MRIRTVKPEFWSHPVLSKLSDEARLAAIGLLNLADDEGFFLAAAALVRSAFWPFDEDSMRARRVLDELSRVGYIEVQEHPTHGPVGVVVNFTKHQKVDRPSQSKIKTYFDSSSVRRKLDESSLLYQGSGIRDQGRDQGASEQDLFDQKAMDEAKAIMAKDAAPMPPALPQAAKPKTFSDWRAMHPDAFIGRNEREDWEALFRLYEYDAMAQGYRHIQASKPPQGRVYLTALTAWLTKHYELTE